MTTLFVRHTVADPTAWRKVYDGLASFQTSMGVTAKAAYQAEDNPKDITVTHDFDSLEKAQAFTKSKELGEAMKNAGVQGAPTMWFTKKW